MANRRSMGLKEIQNLIFDLDGTLVDSSQTISASVEVALSGVGLSSATQVPVKSLIGASLLDIFRKEYGMPESQAQTIFWVN